MRLNPRLSLGLLLLAGCSSQATTPVLGSVKGIATLGGAKTGNRGIVVGITGGQAAITDDAGHFEIDELPAGNSILVAEYPGYLSTDVKVSVAAGVQSLTPQIDLAPAGSQPVDTDGGTVTPTGDTGGLRGTATLGNKTTGNAGIVVGVIGGATAITDDAGHWELDGLRPGGVTLQAQHDGYTPTTVKAVVMAGKVVDAAPLVLAAAVGPVGNTGGVSGVATLGGNKTGNAGIVVGVLGGPAVTTDDAGNYTINGIPTGPVTLRASYPGYKPGIAQLAIVGNQVGMAQEIDLQTVSPPAATSGSVSGVARLTGAQGVMTTGNTGIIVTAPGVGAVTTDDNGNYTITGLPAGNVTVTAQFPGYTSGSTTTTVTLGQTATASEIDLAKPVVMAPPKLTITKVSPARASTVGGDAVTITGTGFDGSTVFAFGGGTARVGTVTATSAVVYAPSSVGSWGGPVTITLRRTTDGSTAANSTVTGSPTAFSYYASTLLFNAAFKANPPNWNTARVPLFGDLNNDGRIDVLVGFNGTPGHSVLLNNGGDFVNAFNDYNQPGFASEKEQLVDLDGDGNLDLLNGDDNGTWQYMLGNGSGRMVARGNNYYQNCSGTISPVAIHLTSTTVEDVAVACYNQAQVRVWQNRGAANYGALYQGPGLILNTAGLPYHVINTDLNRDGKEDLVVVQAASGAATLAWYLQANNTLPTTATGQVGINANNEVPYWGKCADLTGDGFPDCVVSDNNTGTVRVFLNDGNGSLYQPAGKALTVGPDARGITLADMNGDGALDIVVVGNRVDGTVQIIPGKGDGTFGTQTASDGRTLVTGTTLVPADCRNSWSVDVADYDGDGALDLASTCETNDRGEPQFGALIVWRNVSR